MTVPNYMVTFRRALQKQEQAARERGEGVKSVISVQSPPLNTLNRLNTHPPVAFADALTAIEARCPDYVEPYRWRQCLDDARRFLPEWGEQAAALGWTADDLFG